MLLLVSSILETVGAILVGYAAIRVHHRIRLEHRIDKEVLQTVKHEEIIGTIGIVCLIVGFLLELPSHI